MKRKREAKIEEEKTTKIIIGKYKESKWFVRCEKHESWIWFHLAEEAVYFWGRKCFIPIDCQVGIDGPKLVWVGQQNRNTSYEI